MTVIAIIDYEIGNVRSIANALEKVGAQVIFSRDREEILAADGVILPGVGAFSHGMAKLHEHHLVDSIKEFVRTGKPLLGICLGMQLLFRHSEEFGETPGLDLVAGSVVKLETLNPDYQKLPHVSWNELQEPETGRWRHTILDEIEVGEDMYFVHTYAAKPIDPSHVLATTVYSDYEFCSAVKKDNVYGCQFHPEKSATVGLKIINNFLKICKV